MSTTTDSINIMIGRNIAAARVRTRPRITQAELAARMQALGFRWHMQTVSYVEKGQRSVSAPALIGLAYALETSVGVLASPGPDDRTVDMPSGLMVPAESVRKSLAGHNDGSLTWDGDTPAVGEPDPVRALADAGIASWVKDGATYDAGRGEWVMAEATGE